MVAPNGARRTHADHPALPMTLTEIVETARSCHASGAQALHLHMREDDGTHSLDTGRYREALAELATAVPNMKVQITTEAVGIFDVPAQYKCLTEVAPRWASVSVREVARDAALAPKLYAACAEMGCEVQHILYDVDDIKLLQHWQQALEHIGFLDPAAPKKLMPRLNQLLNRAVLTEEEVHILRGIARTLLKR